MNRNACILCTHKINVKHNTFVNRCEIINIVICFVYLFGDGRAPPTDSKSAHFVL